MFKKCLVFLIMASAICFPAYAEFSEVSFDFDSGTIPRELTVFGTVTKIVDGAMCIDVSEKTRLDVWDGFGYVFPAGINKSNAETIVVEYDMKIPRAIGTSVGLPFPGSGYPYLGGLTSSAGNIGSLDLSYNGMHLQALVNGSAASGSLYVMANQADPNQYLKLRTEYNFQTNTFRNYADGKLLTANGKADLPMAANRTALEVRFATPYPSKAMYIDNLKIITVKPMKLIGQTVEDLSIDVPIDAKPQFTFDSMLNIATIGEVKLYNGETEVPIQNTVDSDTLTLVPTSDLEYLTDYKIEITDKLKGSYGESAAAKTISFKTAQLPFYAKDLSVASDGATVKFINNTANVQHPIMLLCRYEEGVLKDSKIEKIEVPTGGSEIIGSATLAGVTNAYVIESVESMGLMLLQ